MKKVLVLLIAFAIVGGAVLFAEPTINENSKLLNVFGFIPSPEKIANLDVTQSLTTPIDLTSSVVKDDGDGVLVGNWKVTTYNHDGGEKYKITYSYGKLVSDDSTQEIKYLVSEFTGASGGTGTAKESGDSTPFTAGNDGGESSITRYVKVNLVDDAGDFDPATDFTSTITLNLTTNN